ncbi:MAG: ribosome small subunit-dependent GTPase A [Eubacteriales bacterium]
MEQSVRGKIIKGVGGRYVVRYPTDGQAEQVACPAKGLFRHAGQKPVVGDEVVVKFEREGQLDTAVLCDILPRRNLLIRPPLANLTHLFVVIAAAQPAPVTETVDKLLAIAIHNGIEPVVVVTKTDLDAEAGLFYTCLYRSARLTALPLSSGTGEGLSVLVDCIDTLPAGSCAAFAGASGVGKSTLLNALYPTLGLQTGEISARIERGRHTTRHVELFPIREQADGGCVFLADTPGFSLLDFARFDFFALEDLFATYREFAPYQDQCRFSDCTHTGEGAEHCAIARAVADGHIAPSRHDSYKTLYATLKEKKNQY